MIEAQTEMDKSGDYQDVRVALAQIGRTFHARGWLLGTSGNLSAVVADEPFRLAITSSGVDKGALSDEHFVEVDANGNPKGGSGRPSAETHLHLAVVRARGAQAVMHTHSIWSTILSDLDDGNSGMTIQGYEMLKGLTGVETHAHREWIPIIENSQDMPALATEITRTLNAHPESHGLLLRRHGLYTWGQNIAEAKRHVEILEFLLEVIGRTKIAGR